MFCITSHLDLEKRRVCLEAPQRDATRERLREKLSVPSRHSGQATRRAEGARSDAGRWSATRGVVAGWELDR